MRLTLPQYPEAAWELSLTNNLGIYIHIPFCDKKCNYCDFYSGASTPEGRREYTERLSEEITKWGALTARPIDTLYIGGGTPSLLSSDELELILNSVRKSFSVLEDAEITVEANPSDLEFIPAARKAGVNRISFGIQSANDEELKLLGRRHNFETAKKAICLARECGFDNISADIMIGLPNSDISSLEKSIEGILSLNTEHISAYILKIEENTPFYKASLSLPDEDRTADQYLYLCERMKEAGYEHYEISNFAKEGYESRHNNRYWKDLEYIGIGPSAHSYFEGKRFYYPRDIKAFIKNPITVDDGEGGDYSEFTMLSLRLSRGLVFSEFKERFAYDLPARVINKARLLEKGGLCRVLKDRISLTDKGMLVSNSIISELLGEF